MANGFLVASPGSRHGASDRAHGDDWAVAQRFTAPSSGTLTISEIGLWCKDSGSSFRLAIYTHDAGNDCPESQVANSESNELAADVPMSKINFEYGTDPEVTGGVIYWLCAITDTGTNINFDYDSGGSPDSGLSISGISYPTWPTPTEWETHTDRSDDQGWFAVYSAAGGLSIPIPAYHYKNQ